MRKEISQKSVEKQSLQTDTIICGDSLEVLKTFPNECIDCVITSPPYDSLRDYNGYSFDFEGIATELCRVIKPGGVIVWVVGDATVNGSETGTSHRQVLFFLDNLGMRLHDTMIYRKNGTSFPSSRKGVRYSNVFEYMFILSKGKPKTIELLADKPNAWMNTETFGQSKMRSQNGELIEVNRKTPVPAFSPRTNIWKYNTGKGFTASDRFAHEHPAPFPEALVEDHLMTWTKEGDIVLDPFNGSGTTSKMAKALERHYIGIDISEEYCELARKRLETIDVSDGSKIDFSEDVSYENLMKNWTKAEIEDFGIDLDSLKN